MINLQTTVNIKTAKALFGDQLPKALPFVKMGMLTRLAAGGREAIVKQLPVDFDRPTPFTLRGVNYKAATPGVLTASVFVPESADENGRAKREYFQPGVVPVAKRRQKKTEFLLTKAGFLPHGWVSTPGKKTAELGMINQYGNLSPRYYAQIVNVLQIKKLVNPRARGISAKSMARAVKMGVDTEWFAVAPGKNTLGKNGSWLPPGVYRRGNGKGKDGDTIHQILKFVRKAGYRPRLDFKGTVEDYVLQNVQSAWDASTRSVFAKFSTPK